MKRLRIYQLGATVLLLLTSCTQANSEQQLSGSDSQGSEAEASRDVESLSGSDGECQDIATDVPRRICFYEEEHGYRSVVVTGSEADAVIVVDPGGPKVDAGSMAEAMRQVASVIHDSTLVGLIPPELDDLDQRCADIANSFAENCPVDEVGDIYFDAYASVLRSRLGLVDEGRPVDLVGSSFASARWLRLLDEMPIVRLRYVAITSPFNGGLTGAELDEAAGEMASGLLSYGLENDCYETSCLGQEWPDYRCSDYCAPENKISLLTGQSPAVVREGLVGLIAFVEPNLRLLANSMLSEDSEALRSLVEQGRSSYLGTDLLGGRHKNEVAMLAAVCPLLAEQDLGHRWSDCEGVERSRLVELIGTRTDPFGDLEPPEHLRLPERSCFLANQPDTVLGLASTSGFIFGQSAMSRTEFDTIGHGDIDLAAKILARMRLSEAGQPQTECLPL